jgi:hypothetical protein
MTCKLVLAANMKMMANLKRDVNLKLNMLVVDIRGGQKPANRFKHNNPN